MWISVWPEADAKLRERWGAGVSCPQIALELGVSADSVIGRAHRIGLPRHPSVANRNLKERDRAQLGRCTMRIGEREKGTQHLHAAVKAFREALEEFTRQHVPLQWAMTQNKLGGALSRIGERENSTERLREAVKALRDALEEHTRQRVPLDWAMTQYNLGAALRMLGERESGTEHLHEAIKAFRDALEEFTRERVPLQWAMTQNGLGKAQALLNERLAPMQKSCNMVRRLKPASG